MVEGLVINDFAANGILVTGSGWQISNDYIGTDLTGATARANGAAGIEINIGSGNTIGGLTSTPGTGAGDLISGNTTSGVYLDAAPKISSKETWSGPMPLEPRVLATARAACRSLARAATRWADSRTRRGTSFRETLPTEW